MSDYLLPRIHYSNAELEQKIMEMIYDHDSSLFTTFTNVSGPKVRIVIGGIPKELAVNADKLDGYHAYSFVLVSDLASHLNAASYVSKAELSAEAYLKKAGGTMTGDINFTSTGSALTGAGITFKHSSTNDARISADTNGALGLYGRSKVVLRPSLSQSIGLEITASYLKYNDGDVLHVGNLKNHQFTNSAYGVLLSYDKPTKTSSQLNLQKTSMASRYYSVVATTNGYAYVNVPWVDDYVTAFQKNESNEGIDFTISMKSGNSFSNSIPMINQDKWGVAKTPFEPTDEITVEELNSYNDTGRWYGVHTLKSGYLAVNIPWVDTPPSIGNHYSPTSFPNSFASFGKFLQGTPSYAIVGMSYSFDFKRHIGKISYSYSKIDANNTYIRSAYFKNENTGYTLYMAYALNTTSTIGYVKTTIPKMTNLSYGVAKTYHANMTTNVTVQSLPASPTTNRWYGTTLTKDGKLIVNVPWTDDFVTSIDYTDDDAGIATILGRNLSDDLKATIPAITTDKFGVAKLAFDFAREVQLSSVQDGSHPVADRWYGIQALKDGSLVTNIPWTDYQTSISGHYAPNSFGNKYDKFGKFITGTTSYAISGMSYSFDNKRHVGVMSYSYSLINADTLDDEHAYMIRSVPKNNGDIVFSSSPLLENNVELFGVYPKNAEGNNPESKMWGEISRSQEFLSDFIPVTPGEILYGEIWANREHADNISSSDHAGLLYYGLCRYDKNKKPISENAGLNAPDNGYFVANGVNIVQDGIWHKYSGTCVIPEMHSPYKGSDGEGVYYVKIRVLVNYSDGTIPTNIGRILLKRNSSIQSRIYKDTSFIGTGSNWGSTTRYFLSVLPKSSFDYWHVKYRITVWIPEDGSKRSTTSIVEYYGYGITYKGYKVWNTVGPTYATYYHVAKWLTATGLSNKFGHAIGESILNSTNYTTASLYRYVQVDLLEYEGCNVELTDRLFSWANWNGGNSTNYTYPGVNDQPFYVNSTSQGLQETGDSTETGTIYLHYTRFIAGANGMMRNSLIMQDGQGKWQSFTTTNGTGNTKTRNPSGFRLGSKIYYLARSSNVNADTAIDGNSQVAIHAYCIDLRYSFNITLSNTASDGAVGLTRYLPIFIVGYIGDDGLFYTDSRKWWTQKEPITDDGKIYIKVCESPYYEYTNNPDGQYRGDLISDGIPMWYKDGLFRPFPERKPSLQIYDDIFDNIQKQITVTAGYMTSDPFKVPYAYYSSYAVRSNTVIINQNQENASYNLVFHNNNSLLSDSHITVNPNKGQISIVSVTSPSNNALYISPTSTLYLDSAASTSILFRKGTTEMARFNTSSNLCIGTTNPNDNTSYKLDVGGKGRFSNQIVSSLANGTAPFVVASSTLVNKLNADMLDGYHASTFVNRIIGTNSVALRVQTMYNWTGVLVTLPFTWTGPNTPGMFAFTVRTYLDYVYTDFVVSGYCYGNSHWHSPKVVVIGGGTSDIQFKFGWFDTADSSGAKHLWVWFGRGKDANDANDNVLKFSYGGFTIINVHCGHSDTDMYVGWSAEQKSPDDLTNVQETIKPNYGYATHIAGGAKGNIIYQSGSSTSEHLAIGSTGQVLAVNGSGNNRLPAWKNLNDIHNHDDQYLQLSGGTITGNLTVNGNTTLGDANTDTVTINAKTTAYSDVILKVNSGSETPGLIFNRAGSGCYDWKAYVNGSGELSFASSTDATAWNRKIYVEAGTDKLHATLKGNADTATTLATTRTLWGQNFNGSANVTGDMSSVGSISASGNITTTKSGTSAVKISVKNNSAYEIGLYTSANRGIYDFTSGKWLIAYNAASTYTFLGVGNVGIGTTTTPTVKLDVAGSIKSSDTVQAVKFKTTSYEISQTSGGRLAFGTHGQSVAAPVNVGNLLVSNAWADYTNVPTNGIYAKGNIKTAAQLISSVSTGTAPLVVTSTTKVDNLNADLLDGKHASEFSISSHNHDDRYLLLSGGTITGDFNVLGITKLDNTNTSDLTVNGKTVAYADISLCSNSGNSPSLIFRAGSNLTDWKMQVKSGNLYFSSATDGLSFTDRAYFKDGTKQLYADLLGNATSATTATNLASAPSFASSGTTQITLTAGGQTSAAFTVPYATNAETAAKVTVSTNSANASYNIVFNSGTALYSDSDIKLNPSTGEVTAKYFTVTHANGGGNEFRVKYSTTVDMAMMIGSGNANHGLYDIKNEKWMIVANAAGNVTMNGNATTATTLATTRTLWGQNFNGSANVTGDMSSVGSISASGNIITEKSGTTAVKISVKNNSTNEIGLYTSANRGIYDFTSGKWLIAYNAASTYTFLGVGNVGIGCEPDVKLDVNGQIKSRAANGTAPFVVASTTKVDNLNADLLDGEHSYTLRSRPDNGGDVLFSMIPYINSRVNPFNKAVNIDIAPGDAPFGYCFGPTTDYVTYVSGYIPVIPGDIIRGETYAYRDIGASGTNAGKLYCGIKRFDRNKCEISSTLYFVTSNTAVTSDGVWHKYSGTTTIPTTHEPYPTSNPVSDGGAVYYIKIILYVNYNKNDSPPTYIGGCQFTRLNPFYDIRYVTKSELSEQSYLKTSGGTMTGAINRNYTDPSDDPVINVASSNKDIWLWRVRSGDSGTSTSVSGVYGFGTKYLGTGTGNNNSWAMYADNGSGTQVMALEMKQSGDLFAYAPIHWANSTALPEDTTPQYLLSVDSFTNGGKTKWTSIANLRTAVGFAVGSYLPLAGGTMTGDINFTSTGSALTGAGITFKHSSTNDAHISAATNWGLGLYGAGNVAIRPSLTDSTVGVTMTTTDLKYNGGDILHVGNLSYHQFTNSAYGVLLSYAPPTKTSSQLGLKKTNTAGRYYGVMATTNGYAYVNVPWTDNYISGFEYVDQDGVGINTNISTALGSTIEATIPIMNQHTLGVARTVWKPVDMDPAHLITEPDWSHTDVDRWYGAQLTKGDCLVVYVPWTDTTPNQINHYAPNNFVNNYNQFGKYVSTAASYAIIGMSYSFDSKRHIGVISYAYAPVSSTNTYIRTTYFTTHTYVKGLQVNITYGSTANTTSYVTYNNSRPVIPVADASSYGVIKVARTSTITKSNCSSESSTTQRYLVSMTKDGFAYVGVPWTDTNTKVTQKQATGNATYSLLMRYTAGTGTGDDTNFAYFDTSLKYNAALNALTNEGGSYFATTSGWVDVGTASHSSNFHTYGNATIEDAAYVKSGNVYIGSRTGSQCHQEYDATKKCLKFIFD